MCLLHAICSASAEKQQGAPHLHENAGIKRCAGFTIQKIGGWKTRSVFERYNIVTQSDIQDAMAKLEANNEKKSDAVTQNG